MPDPRRAHRAILALALALAVPPVRGQTVPPTDASGLPAPADVARALDAHPSVEAANARTDAARAEAEVLARGPYEFTMTGSYLSRTVNDPAGIGNGRFDEFEAQITRPVRLPGKAALDQRIGTLGLGYARNMAEDSRHQAALRLAQAWWDWLGAAADAGVDRQSVANAEALLASVRRRVALRDAASLDEAQVLAALDLARAQAERSRGREAVAHARLAAQFPHLPLPPTPQDVPQPDLPAGGLAVLHDKILDHSHEIAAAQALAAQAEAQAQRARRDRIGDPSFGLRVFSEKGGMEKGAGVLFSLPFGGGSRSAAADRAGAQARAIGADLAAVRLNLQETADADLAEAQAGVAAWQEARQALDGQLAASRKVQRGQQLGAISLADVLLAERQVHDAMRIEAAARTDAMRALTRIRIDSHQLWIVDEAREN